MPRTVLIFLLALSFTACSGGDESTAIPEPDQLLATVADAMHATSGARFDLIRAGEPVFIDSGGLFVFNEAIGSYSPPAAAAVRIQAAAFGLVTEVDAVSVDGDAWYTHPVTGAWERLPVTFGFDPVALFDPTDGWRPLLTRDLSDIKLVEGEYEGKSVWMVTGTTAPERLEVITAGLVADQAVEMTLFIDKKTNHVLETSFTSQNGEGTTDWTLRLYDFGSEFDIQLPEAAK